jgi:hypothetical protein
VDITGTKTWGKGRQGTQRRGGFGRLGFFLLEFQRLFWKLHPDLYRAYDKSLTNFVRGDWKHPVWETYGFLQSDSSLWHFVHQSVDDPCKVAYYPSIKHLLEGREIRTKPGRYLQKYYSKEIDAGIIRHIANQQVNAGRPSELHFVEDDDPDGWEWVYEHGHGFTSCMVRRQGHLKKDIEHPVRVYAHKGNGLRLAWLGKGYKQDDGGVYARTIVRDAGESSGYVRIYGDDSAIRSALDAAGYSGEVNLSDVRLERIENDEGSILCPYLDGDVNKVIIEEGCLRVAPDGYATNTSGALDAIWCDQCGEIMRGHNIQGAQHLQGRHFAHHVCAECSDLYTYAYGQGGERYSVLKSNTIHVEGDVYDIDYLKDNNIGECEECGDHFYMYDGPTRKCRTCQDGFGTGEETDDQETEAA